MNSLIKCIFHEKWSWRARAREVKGARGREEKSKLEDSSKAK
ncbi:hypothetical protein A2U01_0094265, partial [Trifolium medium]|nr:hypothetical protein [Trifolium medium]